MNLYAHGLFMAPNLILTLYQISSFGVLLTGTALTLLDPDHDGFIRVIFSIPLQMCGAVVATYLLQRKDVKAYLSERKHVLKWQ